MQGRYYNEPRGLILDLPDSSYQDCQIKIQVEEMLEHVQSMRSSRVFIYPCEGYEKLSKKEIEDYLKKTVPDLDVSLMCMLSQEGNLNCKKVTCFVCVFNSEKFASFFINHLVDSNVCRATGYFIRFD